MRNEKLGIRLIPCSKKTLCFFALKNNSVFPKKLRAHHGSGRIVASPFLTCAASRLCEGFCSVATGLALAGFFGFFATRSVFAVFGGGKFFAGTRFFVARLRGFLFPGRFRGNVGRFGFFVRFLGRANRAGGFNLRGDAEFLKFQEKFAGNPCIRCSVNDLLRRKLFCRPI